MVQKKLFRKPMKHILLNRIKNWRIMLGKTESHTSSNIVFNIVF